MSNHKMKFLKEHDQCGNHTKMVQNGSKSFRSQRAGNLNDFYVAGY